ncbi:hypothetical protein EDB89DRAFT_2164704 [Lactarius sanguifluus]|nr:hypothetical protein EDB89DRAFT_2164704 [Lactarius sanguifluus]
MQLHVPGSHRSRLYPDTISSPCWRASRTSSPRAREIVTSTSHHLLSLVTIFPPILLSPLLAVSFPTVSLARTSRPALVPCPRTCVMPTLPTLRCRVKVSLAISPPSCLLATLSPPSLFLPPSRPLIAPPSHSLPSHMSATVAFVLLLAGIPRPVRRFTALHSHCIHNRSPLPNCLPSPTLTLFPLPSRNLTVLGVLLPSLSPSQRPPPRPA